MGCWDIFCPICGLPLGYNIIDSIRKNGYGSYIESVKISGWSNKCTLLLLNTVAKHGFTEIACNITFSDKKDEIMVDNIGNTGKFGIAVHTDCWKYASRILSRKLVLDDFDMKKGTREQYKFSYLKNKELSKYHGQDFDLESFCSTPNNLYLLYSPLDKSKSADLNRSRIKDNILIIDKHKPKSRPSPCQSATIFEAGTELKGGDGRIYIVKNINKVKRWVPSNK
jgi:hypothetical protein